MFTEMKRTGGAVKGRKSRVLLWCVTFEMTMSCSSGGKVRIFTCKYLERFLQLEIHLEFLKP